MTTWVLLGGLWVLGLVGLLYVQPVGALGVIALSRGLLLYWLPAFVAERRRHRQTTAIVVLNLLLGWTFVGWVVALVWALTVPPGAAADDPH
jgi:hypothetical protein